MSLLLLVSRRLLRAVLNYYLTAASQQFAARYGHQLTVSGTLLRQLRIRRGHYRPSQLRTILILIIPDENTTEKQSHHAASCLTGWRAGEPSGMGRASCSLWRTPTGPGYTESLLIRTWRKIVCGWGSCPLILQEFSQSFGKDAAEVLATLCVLPQAVGYASLQIPTKSPGDTRWCRPAIRDDVAWLAGALLAV